MKRKLYRLFFVFSFIIFLILSYFYILRYNFDSYTLKENIEYLASNKIQGRLPGTKENDLIAESLSKKLLSLGLTPLDKSFKEGFQLTVPYKVSNKGSLDILKGDKIITSLEYGVDFKEDLLNFKDNSITLNKGDKMKIFESAITFYSDNNLFLFYLNTNENFDFRSSFMHNSPFAFAVGLAPKAFTLLKAELSKGNSININLPYSTKVTEVFNVSGKIEGSDKSLKPLILSAHFDHLGTDCLDNIYCGALDNASGSCFLLEVAKSFSSLKIKPKRDIIFVFLNAEEFGLLGSEAFSKKYSSLVNNSEVINFDMIGSPIVPLSLIRGEKEQENPSNIEKDLKAFAPNLEVVFENSSDHASFLKYGADALTLTNSDTSKIHTPKDKSEYISTDSLNNAFKIVEKKIFSYCYSPLKNLLLNDYIYLSSFSIVLLFIMYKNINYLNHKKK